MRRVLKSLYKTNIFEHKKFEEDFMKQYKDPKYFWNYRSQTDYKDTTINQMLGYFDDIYKIKDQIIKHLTTIVLSLYHKNTKSLKQLCNDQLYQALLPQIEFLQQNDICFDFHSPPYMYLQHKKNDIIVLCGVTLEEYYSAKKEDFQIEKVESIWNSAYIYIHKNFNPLHYPLFIFDIECFFSYIKLKRVFKEFSILEEINQRKFYEFRLFYVQSFCTYDDFFRGYNEVQQDQSNFLTGTQFNCQVLKPKILASNFNKLIPPDIK